VELAFKANFRVTNVRLISNIELNTNIPYFSDPTCVLLPPRRASPPSTGVLNQIIAALATRYDKTVTVIRKNVPVDQIEEWGKVRRMDGGDTMNASALVSSTEDRRDATFVRVSVPYVYDDL
jgi:hypothetical protein